MTLDHLDTTNPYRLKAFFLFCHAANTAREAAEQFRAAQLSEPASAVVIRMFEAQRQRAVGEALQQFNGGDFKAHIPDRN